MGWFLEKSQWKIWNFNEGLYGEQDIDSRSMAFGGRQLCAGVVFPFLFSSFDTAYYCMNKD